MPLCAAWGDHLMKRIVLKPILPALILPFLAFTSSAQQATGYSHPDQNTDLATQNDHYVKPSHDGKTAPAYQDSFPATAPAPDPKLISREAAPASAPAAEVAPEGVQYAPYQPASVQTASAAPVRTAPDAADGEIVLDVPTRPHELNRGTLLHARLRETVSTKTTVEGSVFTAELLSDVGHHGEIMLPAGSLIRGHISSVHGGSRISGGASVHLRPETVSLPDGTLYRINAQITDVESTQDLRVNDEGTVVLKSNPKAAAAVVGGVTATAAVTGAVVGGGVGAAVGAVAGAGVATAVYLKRDVQETMPAGTDVIFALDEPLVVTAR
jgi:hypothetical protein